MKVEKKERKTSIGSVKVHVDEGDCISINFNLDTGRYSIVKNGSIEEGPLTHNLTYMGERKERSVFEFPCVYRHCEEIYKAIQDFDVVCAVDCSLTPKDPFISVGVATIVRNIRTTEDGKTLVEIQCVYDVEWDPVKPEKFEQRNWMKMYDWILADSVDKKILMIVDSDKDNLGKYNDRIEPVYGSRILPTNLVLAYASDRAKDHWSNQLISFSDKYSKVISKAITEQGSYSDQNIMPIGMCSFTM